MSHLMSYITSYTYHIMVTSSRLLTAAARAATALQLLGLASAAPPLVAPGPLEGRSPDATMSATATATTTATDAAWVSVGASGTPVTVTPLVTVVDGTTTTLSAVPNDLTATVVTRTGHAEDTTSTGTTAPGPTATGADGSGSFLVCDNADGEYAPFCQPVQNSSLYPGTTYYGAVFLFETFVVVSCSFPRQLVSFYLGVMI